MPELNSDQFPQFSTPLEVLSNVAKTTARGYRHTAGKNHVMNHGAAVALGPEHHREAAAKERHPGRREHLTLLAEASDSSGYRPPARTVLTPRSNTKYAGGVSAVTDGLPYRSPESAASGARWDAKPPPNARYAPYEGPARPLAATGDLERASSLRSYPESSERVGRLVARMGANEDRRRALDAAGGIV